MPRSRRPPFDADGKPSSAGSDNDADVLWRRKVAEAARLAAEDLARENHPATRQLLADLIDLEARMRDADTQPPDAADPRAAT